MNIGTVAERCGIQRGRWVHGRRIRRNRVKVKELKSCCVAKRQKKRLRLTYLRKPRAIQAHLEQIRA